MVCLDSDEHDEDGYLTEDLELRIRMVDKRLRKLDAINRETPPVEYSGPSEFHTLVLSWGSVNPVVREAVERLAGTGLACIGLQRIYPLPPDLKKYLHRAGRTIMVENNATGQMSKLLQRETGHSVDHRILKYNGLSFTVEELVAALDADLRINPAGEVGK